MLKFLSPPLPTRQPSPFNDLTGQNFDDGFVDNVQVITSDYFNSLLEAVTDSSGHYQILAPNASFQVGVSGLGSIGFQNVSAQAVSINNANASANFVATPLTGVQFYAISTAANPATAGTATGGGSFVSGASITVTATVTNSTLPYTRLLIGRKTGSSKAQAPAIRSPFCAAVISSPTSRCRPEVISATVSPANSGTVVGSGSSIHYNSTATLTASADFGYQFSQWTDQNNNVLGAAPGLLVTVLSNATYTANFTATNLNHHITTRNLARESRHRFRRGQLRQWPECLHCRAGLCHERPHLLSIHPISVEWKCVHQHECIYLAHYHRHCQSNLALTAVYGIAQRPSARCWRAGKYPGSCQGHYAPLFWRFNLIVRC